MKSNKPNTEQNIGKPTRRDFLQKAWKILGLIAVAELGIFTLNLLKPGKESNKNKSGSSIKVVGNIEDFPINSVTTDRANKFYLIREQDGAFLALSLMCSHLGCSVGWDESKNKFICPCHSSVFDKRGNVLNSPAPRPLDYFPVLIEEGKVKIDFGKKIKRKKFETNQLTYAI